MADQRTGRAPGTINPVIYLENASGHLLLLPVEKGQGHELARRIWKERYEAQGYDWREASNWNDVKRLQERLVEQERRSRETQAEQHMSVYDVARKKTFDNLRQRMASSDCKPFERDMIEIWLRAKEDKGRAEVEQRLREWGSHYLWICENDAGTKVEDRMKGENSL